MDHSNSIIIMTQERAMEAETPWERTLEAVEAAEAQAGRPKEEMAGAMR